MTDTSKDRGLRKQLVSLIKSKGIKDSKVLNAMLNVPRHWFMDPSLNVFAYDDKAYPIAADQTISQPYTVAFQTELLKLKSGDKVLEIGTGSGYQTSILIELGYKVYTVERQKILFNKSQLIFRRLKWKPKKIIFGDGYNGFPDDAPYNGIIVTAGAPYIPKNLLKQLVVGGKLIIPVGVHNQKMTRVIRTSENEFDKETFGNFRFVPLIEDNNSLNL